MENAKLAVSSQSKIRAKRDPNFTEQEKWRLAELIKDHKNVIEAKHTDTVTNKMKDEVWMKVVELFNQQSFAGTVQRNYEKLRALWKAMKANTRKKLAEDKLSIHKTGGGPRVPSRIDALNELIMRICEGQFVPESNDVDDDAIGLEQYSCISVPLQSAEVGVKEFHFEVTDTNTSAPTENCTGTYELPDVSASQIISPYIKSGSCQKFSKVTSTITRPVLETALYSKPSVNSQISESSPPLDVHSFSLPGKTALNVTPGVLSGAGVSPQVTSCEHQVTLVSSGQAARQLTFNTATKPFFRSIKSPQKKRAANVGSAHASIQSMAANRNSLISLEQEIANEKRANMNIIHAEAMQDIMERRKREQELHEQNKLLLKLKIEKEKLKIAFLKSKLGQAFTEKRDVEDDDITPEVVTKEVDQSLPKS